jgi:hypothetical protein
MTNFHQNLWIEVHWLRFWHSFSGLLPIWGNVWTNRCTSWKKIASPATCSLKSTLNLEDELGMSWVVASYASRWKRGKHSDWRNLQNDTGTCHGRLSLFLLNSLFSTCTFLPRALAAGKNQSKLQRLANQRPKEFGQSQWIPKSITLHDLVTTKARSPSVIPPFSLQDARPVCGWFINLIYYGYTIINYTNTYQNRPQNLVIIDHYIYKSISIYK